MFIMVNIKLRNIFRRIGLTDKHAVVYEFLLRSPSMTPLALARETKLNRTSLYRYLEDLNKLGLVENVMANKSSKYKAMPQGLNQYLLNEEARVTGLKKEIPTLVEELSKLKTDKRKSEVRYFQGVEGLKQMLWNVVHAKSEFVGLGYENWNTSVGKPYAEKLRQIMMERKQQSRELLNKPDDTFEYTALGSAYTNVYEHRLIEPSALEIKHDTYIYDEVFAYFYHYQGELFGVEIHNPIIAKTERQTFEILWKMAEKTKK